MKYKKMKYKQFSIKVCWCNAAASTQCMRHAFQMRKGQFQPQQDHLSWNILPPILLKRIC